LPLGDTIVAIATPPGRSALGIVRLSGPASRVTAAQFLSPMAWRAGTAHLGEMRDAQGHVVDQVIVTFFERPHSFTAEDVVEICCHGSPVVLRHAVQSAVNAGARLAEPGEFTMRAFLNGRLDLPQAEAVRDLIEATTIYQARVAVQQTAGSVSRRIAPIKEHLLELILLLEAGIDFAEDDISVAASDEILRRLAPVESAVDQLVASFSYGGLVQQGFTLAIVGKPNVGKSSLFNRLLEQDRAIVTSTPGTTRDVVSQTIQIQGVPLHVVDTAGLRDSVDEVEQIGIARAWGQIEGADAVLFLHDLTRAPLPDYALADEEIARLLATKLPASVPVIDIWSKFDAAPGANPGAGISLSAKTGFGIEALRRRLLEVAGWQSVPEGVYLARARHVQALARVDHHIAVAAEHLAARAQSLDLLAEELRLAQNALNEITGEFGADDLLGVIFSRYCIGK